MSEYYDRAGKPLTYEQYIALQGIMNREQWLAYKRVAYDKVTDIDGQAVKVSTVWLGLDHSMGYRGSERAPLIFESMAFGGEWNDYCERYSSETQALAGHDQLVARVKQERSPLME